MIHLILATHSILADSFLTTAKMIAGETSLEDVKTLGMTENKSVEEFSEEAKAILAEDPEGKYLLLVDMFGASPCNTLISVFRSSDYRIITGLNLGMLLEALYLREQEDLDEICEILETNSKEGIKKIYLHV